MFLRNTYYSAKPFLPARLRWAVRRRFAERKRKHVRDFWPILESAGSQPAGWPGWPDRKQFALVLTHDVESSRGLDNVRRVAKLEMEFGLRSCFYFVPEGEYTVPPSLISWLKENEFEVGVHDLRHDGKLYRSRKTFANGAKRINRYLKEWGAVGYRSGFMFHNLDWHHDLDIEYDASTFDTDPFEPQPDGVGTVFPFFVPAACAKSTDTKDNGSCGYIELPYTLPQDSTLFSLFSEPSPEIWNQKTDWIARQGGMALLSTHPDYMSLGSGTRHGTYPLSHYARFLEGTVDSYSGRFWNALPKEIAEHLKLRSPGSNLPQRPRRICMVSYSHYESDNRVLRYAHALRDRGDIVDALSLNNAGQYATSENLDGVHVRRLQSRERNEKGMLDYILRTFRFFRSASKELRRRHRYTPYDLVHVHNVPDFLVFAARFPKRKGARIILDLHDILPEFFASKFKAGEKSRAVSFLKFIERISCRFANHVIISNHLWRETLVNRSISDERCSVFINYVDLAVFSPTIRQHCSQRPIVLYPGGLQWHQGLDIAIKAFKTLHDTIPQALFHIHGEGPEKENLQALVSELDLNNSVRFFSSVPHSQVPALMAAADLGVVAKRADSFGNEAYSTKIMEFMSQGVPVIVSETRIDRYYFDDTVVRFFESGNATELAETMIDLLTNHQSRIELTSNAAAYSARHCWDAKKAEYLELADGLIDRTRMVYDQPTVAAGS